MPAHIASGSVVLQKDAPVTVQVGPLQARFTQDDKVAKAGVDLTIQVPFDRNPPQTSTTNLSIKSDDYGTIQLIVVFVSAGARGEIVSANYSLYEC